MYDWYKLEVTYKCQMRFTVNMSFVIRYGILNLGFRLLDSRFIFDKLT